MATAAALDRAALIAAIVQTTYSASILRAMIDTHEYDNRRDGFWPYRRPGYLSEYRTALATVVRGLQSIVNDDANFEAADETTKIVVGAIRNRFQVIEFDDPPTKYEAFDAIALLPPDELFPSSGEMAFFRCEIDLPEFDDEPLPIRHLPIVANGLYLWLHQYAKWLVRIEDGEPSGDVLADMQASFDEPIPNELILGFSGISRKLLEYLWPRGLVTVKELLRDVWSGRKGKKKGRRASNRGRPKGISAKTVKETVRTLNCELNGTKYYRLKIGITVSGDIFYLFHPNKKHHSRSEQSPNLLPK